MGGDWVEDLIQDMRTLRGELAEVQVRLGQALARLDQVEAEISLLDLKQEEE